ncbi:hypothetical protein [Ligilactobacillus salivarius]|uniref:hypothetical protein n=1 Tax=Ligilactobacillus salivarius TaxID=1624 RepID=UPI0024B9E65D|nr:hypothetical protein [Ligilactobacillus salivarius]
MKYVVSNNNLKVLMDFFNKDEIVRRTANVNDTVHRILNVRSKEYGVSEHYDGLYHTENIYLLC